MSAHRRRTWSYQPMDWLAVRTPLLPAEPGRGPRPGGASAELALWIGSQDLWEALRSGPASATAVARRDRKAARYLDRMSRRPTPFGLFAGVAVGRWAERTDLGVRRMPGRTGTRLDMGWLLALVEQLEADVLVRRQLDFVRHPAVLVSKGRLYLLDPLDAPPEQPTGCLSLRATAPVLAVLEAARTAVPYGRLVAAVREAVPGAAAADVEGLIERLRRSGVLLSGLRPALTVPDPAEQVARRLAGVVDPAGRPARLRWLVAQARRCDRVDAAVGLPLRRALTTVARGLVPGASPEFQTDTVVDLSGTGVHRAVGRVAAEAAELLLRTSTRPARRPALTAYQSAFAERYGLHRAVPLLELVNPHLGLGLPGDDPAPDAGSGPRDEALADLAARALRSGGRTAELDDRTLARIERDVDPRELPPTLELMVLLDAPDPAAVDRGAFRLVVAPGVGSSAAGRTLGRFRFLLGRDAPPGPDPAADDPDVLHADLVYQPLRARSANVAVCPARHRHLLRIGPGAGPADPPDLALDEITVALEEHGLVARRGPDGPRIVPHVPHMINPVAAPRVARFLLELDQPLLLRSFDWGTAQRLPFLPRLDRGAVTLAPARWRLGRLPLRADEPAGFRTALGEFRRTWRMPERLLLVEYDNRAAVDLDRDEDVEELRRTLRRSGTALLQECCPARERAWLPGPDGPRVAELVVPLALKAPADRPADRAAPAPSARPRPAGDGAPRRAAPGSEWVYLKVYAPSVTHDDLLAGPLSDAVDRTLRTAPVLTWHFLRYEDPDPHLRLRFQLAAAEHWPQVAADLAADLRAAMADGPVDRFAFDTYDRELERFGGAAGIGFAERVFAADSTAALALVRELVGRRITVERPLLAAATVDALLSDLGLPAPDRAELAAAMAGPSPAAGPAFRTAKTALRALLDAPGPPPPLARVLTARHTAITAGDTPRPPREQLAAFAHLHCNRLLGIDRPREQTVYGLLARTRRSIARWPPPQAT